MPASIDLELEADEAVAGVRRASENLDEGARDAVDQLTVLAEGAMKAEAPEGAGMPDVHMRSTITTTTEDSEGLRKVVMPRKRTGEGWLLHRAIVGTPSTPSYGDAKPPVWPGPSGDAQGPLAEWADAKVGDRNAAWAIANSIADSGHASFPNPFIDRSVRQWRTQVEDIAGSAIADAVEEAF